MKLVKELGDLQSSSGDKIRRLGQGNEELTRECRELREVNDELVENRNSLQTSLAENEQERMRLSASHRKLEGDMTMLGKEAKKERGRLAGQVTGEKINFIFYFIECMVSFDPIFDQIPPTTATDPICIECGHRTEEALEV